MKENASINLSDLIGSEKYSKVYYLFQVRHIWNHNFGQADIDFIMKAKLDKNMIGKRVTLSEEEIRDFLDLIELLGVSLREKLQECA